jgi:DNA polymerase
MDPARRLRYLQALGVESWRLRATEAPGAQASEPLAGVAEPAAAGDAGVAVDWEGLQAAVATCRRCRLCETRTNTVFGVGPRGAPLMVVGEGPGADEDARGEPFVGRAGKLLDEMLRAIGRSRQRDTFIANVVKCRPPGNREPAEDEAEACLPSWNSSCAWCSRN